MDSLTFYSEIRSIIDDAKSLPADGAVHEQGDIRMKHDPRTKMTAERVMVSWCGMLWRSSLIGGEWGSAYLVSGSI
jgi:hypothetical protein